MNKSSENIAAPGGTKSLSRALHLLDELARHDEGCTLTTLSELAGVHKSTAHRMLATLEQHGLVSRNPDTGRYGIGLRVVELAQAVRSQLAPGPVVRRALTELRDSCEETTYFAVPNDEQMVYIEKIESRQPIRIVSEIGDRLDLYSTALGKSYLSHKTDSEINHYLDEVELVQKTSRTVTSPEMFRRVLRTVREKGYALDDRENEPEIRCIGAPVLDSRGRPVAAVSVSAPVRRLPLAQVQGVAKHVIVCAKSISGQLMVEAGR